jgi:hypothetical protein
VGRVPPVHQGDWLCFAHLVHMRGVSVKASGLGDSLVGLFRAGWLRFPRYITRLAPPALVGNWLRLCNILCFVERKRCRMHKKEPGSRGHAGANGAQGEPPSPVPVGGRHIGTCPCGWGSRRGYSESRKGPGPAGRHCTSAGCRASILAARMKSFSCRPSILWVQSWIFTFP